jgi:GNAT superfamily N-acetyltransferase
VHIVSSEPDANRPRVPVPTVSAGAFMLRESSMSRPPIDVTRVGPSDIDDVLELWTVARSETARDARLPGVDLGAVRERLRSALETDEYHMVMARWSGRPAGYALLRLTPAAPLLEGTILQMDHLFVVPELRRHGIARSLLFAVTGIAERCGADQVMTAAPPGDRETHRYLARLGFSPVLVRRVVTAAVLRRRLAGESRRGGLEDLLYRRRSLRARARRENSIVGAMPRENATVGEGSAVPAQHPLPDPTHTLELPLVGDADLVTDTSAG